MRTAVFVQNRNFFGTQLIHLPLMDALRGGSRDEVIACVPYAGGGVFARTGAADEVRRYDRNLVRTWRMLQRGRFDAVITLQPRSTRMNLAVGLSGAPVRAGFQGPLAGTLFSVTVPRDTRTYRGRCYMELATALGRPHDTGRIFRRLAAHAQSAWEGPNVYCLVPGGGAGAYKRWPLTHYLQLANTLVAVDDGSRFTWLLGPDEAGMADTIAMSEVGGYSRVLVAPSVGEIARAALDSAAVIANDCGQAHVAQLLEVPTVIVFSDEDGTGHAHVAEWFNPHPRAQAVVGPQGARIGAIEPDVVLDAVRAVIAAPG